MKKLMIAAAVVAMAMASQAAKFDWEFGDYSAGSDYAGLTVYSLIGSTAKTDWESLEQLVGASVGSKDIVNVSGDYLAKGTSNDASIIAGSANDAYFVIVNAEGTQYMVTSVDAVPANKIYDGQQSSPGRWDALDSDFFEGGWHDFSGGPTPPPIPEPTSGLLLLVGVAGLALKRRRA